MTKQNDSKIINLKRYLRKAYSSLQSSASCCLPDLCRRKTINPIAVENKFVSCDEDRHHSPHLFWGLYKAIRDSFGLICASPKRSHYFKMFYVFPKKDDGYKNVERQKLIEYKEDPSRVFFQLDSRLQGVYVNASCECVFSFARYLVYLSQPIKGWSQGHYQERYLFLTARYGEGKTFFVNYLLSVCADFFWRKKAIAIRVDFTSIETSDDINIDAHVSIKTLKILHEHYFNSESKKDFTLDLLQKYMNDKDIESGDYEKRYNKKSRSKIHDYFSSKKCNPSSDFDLTDIKSMCDVCSEFCIDVLNHSFVVILDGIDNCYRDADSERIFKKRVMQLKQTLPSKDKRCSYLVVFRNESFAFGLSRHGDTVFNRFKNAKLFPVKTNKIVERKIALNKYILGVMHEANPSFKSKDDHDKYDSFDNSGALVNYFTPDIVKDQKRLLFHFYKFITRFVRVAFEYYGIDTSSTTNLICDVFEGYNRIAMSALVQIMREVLWEIERNYAKDDRFHDAYAVLINCVSDQRIGDEYIKTKFYIIMRSLMLNAKYFSRDKYSFCSPSSGHDLSTLGPYSRQNRQSYSYLPNVFNFKTIPEHVQVPDDANQFQSNLICLRILQFYESVKKSNEEVGGRELVNRLAKDFGYNENVLKSSFRYLYANLCIEKKKLNGSVYKVDDHPMLITRLGSFLANSLICSYPYLEYVSEEVNLELAYCNKYFVPSLSLLPYFDGPLSMNKTEFEDVLVIRSLRVLAMLAYLKQIERLEMKLFKSRRKCSYFSYNSNPTYDDMLFTRKAFTNVESSIFNIVSSRPNSTYMKYIERLHELIEFDRICSDSYK